MRVRSIACLGALLLLAAGPAAAQPCFDFERVATVLPKAVLPSRVQLRLDLDPAQPTFGGEVTITLCVREPVPAIVLHARDLQADDVTLVQGEQGVRGVQDNRPARSMTVAADAKTWQWRLSPVDGRPSRLAPIARRYAVAARCEAAARAHSAAATGCCRASSGGPANRGRPSSGWQAQQRLAGPTGASAAEPASSTRRSSRQAVSKTQRGQIAAVPPASAPYFRDAINTLSVVAPAGLLVMTGSLLPFISVATVPS